MIDETDETLSRACPVCNERPGKPCVFGDFHPGGTVHPGRCHDARGTPVCLNCSSRTCRHIRESGCRHRSGDPDAMYFYCPLCVDFGGHSPTPEEEEKYR